MNYFRIYNEIIKSSINRELDCYTENHHIIPRCMGGSDDNDNIAILTAKEHFLAHWLLAKYYKTRDLIFAWNCMCMNKSGDRYTSKSFSYARESWAKNMSEINKGVKFSKERIKKLSDSHIGQNAWNKGIKTGPSNAYILRVEEYLKNPIKCKCCGELIPYKKRNVNRLYCSNTCSHKHNGEALKKARSAAGYAPNSGSFKKGMRVSNETAKKISKSLTGIKRPTGECPHCGKVGAMSLLKRWHFDNCKGIARC